MSMKNIIGGDPVTLQRVHSVPQSADEESGWLAVAPGPNTLVVLPLPSDCTLCASGGCEQREYDSYSTLVFHVPEP